MGHIKLTVERVKKWVLQLYPLYKGSSEFDVLYSVLPEGSTPTSDDKAITMTANNVKVVANETFKAYTENENITIDNTGSRFELLNTTYNKKNIVGWIDSKFRFIVREGFLVLKNSAREWFKVETNDSTNKDVDIKPANEFHMKENVANASVKVKDGNLYIDNAGLIIDRNAPASRTEGGNTYYIYNGTDLGLGYYTGKSATSDVSIPNGQWGDWKKISGYAINVPSGVYTVTCSLGASSAAVKSRAVGVRAVWSDGTTNTVIKETEAVSTSNGSISAEHIVTSAGIVSIPYGKENNTIYLEGFQRYSSGAFADGRATISVTKIA